MYAYQLNMRLYLQDRIHLDRQFAEMGEAGWADLVSGKNSGPDPLRDEARAIFLMPYGVGDAATIGVLAAREFAEADKADWLPAWVYEVAPLGLIGAINRANEGEVSDDDRRRNRRQRQRKRTG